MAIDSNGSIEFKDMVNRDFSELTHDLLGKVVLDTCLKLSDAGVREGSVPKIEGSTGVGKSWCVTAHARATAARENCEFRDWHKMSYDERALYASNTDAGREYRDKLLVLAVENLVICETCDFQMPSFEADKPYFVWKPSILYWALSLPGARVYLFYDEIGHARHDVQAAMFRVVLDRALGSVAFQPGVFICAATNGAEDRAGVHEMLLPLRRRFSNYRLAAPTSEAWLANFARPNGLDSKVQTFIDCNPQSFLDSAEAAVRAKSGGFACPATWHAVSNKIKDMQLDLSGALAGKGAKHVKERMEYEFAMLISGDVGTGHAVEFSKFITEVVLARPLDYLDNPAMADGLTGADEWKLAAALPELYRENPKRLDPILSVLNRLDKAMFNMAARTMISVAKSRAAFVEQLRKCKNREMINQLAELTYVN